MFEKKHQPLASLSTFILRILNHLGLAAILISIALIIGMAGLTYFENMTWVDSFSTSAMILSGVGATSPIVSQGGKIFAGFYALFSGLAFLTIVSILLAPLVHRFLHKFYQNHQQLEKFPHFKKERKGEVVEKNIYTNPP